MDTIMTLDQVGKSFGKRTILEAVSLSINRGEIYGLLGPSGCGKTTTVKMIAGIMKPDHGRIEVMSKKVPDFGVTLRTSCR